VSSDQAALHAARLRAQLLSGEPARDPVAVAERLLAIQGQDQRGARLAVRARTAGLTAADVDRALTVDRSLLITWLNRGTLHLVRSEDYAWLHALTTPPLAVSVMTRLRQCGVTPAAADRAVDVIGRSLVTEGPLTRAALRDRIDAAGVRTEDQAGVHLLFLATLRNIAVRGPMIGNQHAYAHVEDWLPKSRAVDRGRALAELARRYLVGHGPASDRDLSRWAGLPLRDARAGLNAIAAELAWRPDGLVELARAPQPAAELPPPRLLGAFDPSLLGWTSRADIVGAHATKIVSGGVFRPFAMVEGRAVGVWKLLAGRVELEPFGRLSAAVGAALEADGRDVVRFLGG
jgi:winged helix DNA-binding protein